MNYANFLIMQDLADIAKLNTKTFSTNPNILYKINLETREVEIPKILGVQNEHQAEIIYFELDRYYDTQDLSQTHCAIQYVVTDENGVQHGYIHPVPYCDIDTRSSENKMLIPWDISFFTTQYSGTVKFFIHFYLFKEDEEHNKYFTYSLRTLPKSAKIVKSLFADEFVLEGNNIPIDLDATTAYIEDLFNNHTNQIQWYSITNS